MLWSYSLLPKSLTYICSFWCCLSLLRPFLSLTSPPLVEMLSQQSDLLHFYPLPLLLILICCLSLQSYVLQNLFFLSPPYVDIMSLYPQLFPDLSLTSPIHVKELSRHSYISSIFSKLHPLQFLSLTPTWCWHAVCSSIPISLSYISLCWSSLSLCKHMHSVPNLFPISSHFSFATDFSMWLVS